MFVKTDIKSFGKSMACKPHNAWGEEIKYINEACVGKEGTIRCRTNAYIADGVMDVGADIFQRGCCLPSDNKMTSEQQDRIIEVIKRCFE